MTRPTRSSGRLPAAAGHGLARWPVRLVMPIAGLLLIGACAAPAIPSSTPRSTLPSASGSPSTDDRFAAFAPCTDSRAPGWLCASLEVPLDRADPAAGTIPIFVWVKPHTDLSAPAAEPFFTTPGGPGYFGLANFAVFWMSNSAELLKHHDLVTMDPRGTGQSGAINCVDLQDGVASRAEWDAAVAACAAQLGSASDRYGAADRAMDVEAVRAWLGYDQIDYHGQSAASIDVQAYAARVPQHLRAVVLDSGFSVTGADAAIGPDGPSSLLDVAQLTCAATADCARAVPDARATLSWLVHAVAGSPLTGKPSGGGAAVTIGESDVGRFLAPDDLVGVVEAAASYQAGNPQPLIDIAAANPAWNTAGDGDYREYSSGDNIAATCTDTDTPWLRTDPIAVRRQKLDAANAALPATIFAPWSKSGWDGFNPSDECINWPAPQRYEAVRPAGSTFPGIPTLILAGDRDMNVPIAASRSLAGVFPDSRFVLIPGAGHPTLSLGACVADLIVKFIETLVVAEPNCPAGS